MAGGLVRYRHLSRDSSARQALLRGLVTQLVQYEHIQTTHAKAKEAQRLAEKLITLAKNGNETSRRSAHGILYEPETFMPKVFGELRSRYATREGGYTRVVRTEPRDKHDQAETSILEFVDGPKDSRFMMTAKTVARDRLLGRLTTPVTQTNIKKVTQFRGEQPFEAMVRRFMKMGYDVEATPEEERGAKTAHWKPKLANLKFPKSSPAVARDDGPSLHELEAAKLAEKELKKTAELGAQVAPGSSKN